MLLYGITKAYTGAYMEIARTIQLENLFIEKRITIL